MAKGRTKIVRVDLQGDRPDDDTLLDLMLGRSGRLRAPTLRSGPRLFVGYNAEMMEVLLE